MKCPNCGKGELVAVLRKNTGKPMPGQMRCNKCKFFGRFSNGKVTPAPGSSPQKPEKPERITPESDKPTKPSGNAYDLWDF